MSDNRKIKRAEIIAVIMLGIGLTVLIVGFIFLFTIYKTYNSLSTSTVYKGVQARDKENDDLDEVNKLLDEITNIYESSYVGEIERENIDEYLCNSLIEAYGDRYGIYKDPYDTYEANNSINSLISGIGILARAEIDETQDNYDIYIIDVYDNSPAMESGLKVGDKIIAINGRKLSNTKYMYTEALKDIKGNQGTSVELTYIDSDNNKEKTVSIIRRKTSTTTVRYKVLVNNIGYIIIRGFEDNTSKDFISAIQDLQQQGINKFIFDLRDNSGGIKESVVEILDFLLDEGILMYEYNNEGKLINTNYSDSNHIEFESVTLIGKGTASAAELFTQCLKDFNKTTVVGSTSFGKGTVCTTFPLSNGGSLTVSTENYLTESKIIIEGYGVEPDEIIELDKETEKIRYKIDIDQDKLINRAIEILLGTENKN